MEPGERMKDIQRQVNTVARDTAPMLKELGLEVDTNFPEIDARIIDAPKIAYAGGAQARFLPTCKRSGIKFRMAFRTRTIQNRA